MDTVIAISELWQKESQFQMDCRHAFYQETDLIWNHQFSWFQVEYPTWIKKKIIIMELQWWFSQRTLIRAGFNLQIIVSPYITPPSLWIEATGANTYIENYKQWQVISYHIVKKKKEKTSKLITYDLHSCCNCLVPQIPHLYKPCEVPRQKVL